MFLPLKDINPTRRTPYVTVGLIAVNILAFLYELTLGHRVNDLFVSYGAIPYEITHFTDLVGRYRGSPIVHAPGPPVVWLTLFSSMFLHGGFLHLFGNMLYLWIFGNNIEDLLGPIKFILFYLGCGLVASLTHVLLAPNSTVPTIGASGAVAGVLGAYLVAFPHARVICLLFLVFFVQLVVVPAKLVLLFWFVIQAFQGVASLSANVTGGVAWFAHVGGFVAGLAAIKLVAARQLEAMKAGRRWENNI